MITTWWSLYLLKSCSKKPRHFLIFSLKEKEVMNLEKVKYQQDKKEQELAFFKDDDNVYSSSSSRQCK